ncbi:MAG: hypothetical protein J6A67_05825 [Clostridia bacterium]|nr:hypothetical protein [Clostridia bacterium]
MLHKLNKRAVVIIVAIVALIAVVGSSLAWFVTRRSLFQNFSLSSFEYGAEVYFLDDDKEVNADEYKDEKGLYILSTDKNDVNYIGNLRAKINHSGAKACVRVTMNHQWTLADGTVAQNTVALPYKFAKGWYDNRDVDYSVYYASEDMSGEASFNSADFITGFDEKAFDTSAIVDGVTLKVLVQVDAVQVNRYPQMWDIEKFPWE